MALGEIMRKQLGKPAYHYLEDTSTGQQIEPLKFNGFSSAQIDAAAVIAAHKRRGKVIDSNQTFVDGRVK